ncbi:Bro-N domain-containing protein [Pseudomonas sp. W5-36]|uniref:BRO-N domain-containing protein n=1 Tax=Pseudomonas sp. W5-36 TaxID=3097455 RepID=UPI00397DC10F
MNTPMLLEYQTDGDSSKIRSFYIKETLYVSLEDVVLMLAKSNKAINNKVKVGLGELIKAQLKVLDTDEYENFSVPDDKSNDPRQEVFITQPGLFRLISTDSTPASKKFQRWLFHEVLPSIHKHGTYPPPSKPSGSEIMSLAHALAQNTNLLIREIEEREKLAHETRLRFENTERQLHEINKKIEDISPQTDLKDLTNIPDYCKTNNISIDHQHLWAMCTKLCIEQGVRTKNKLSTNGTQEHLYPPIIINEAVKMIQGV